MSVGINSGDIFKLKTEDQFNDFALKIFFHQCHSIAIYGEWCNAIGQTNPKEYLEIPMLPIEFFKTHRVLAAGHQPRQIFESSGTTGQRSSQHFVSDLSVYHKSIDAAHIELFGDLSRWNVYGLLPNYLERGNSSLVYMVNRLMKSNTRDSGFFLDQFQELRAKLCDTNPTVLFGVSYALLDFMETVDFDCSHITIVETGGMKGRKKEMTRDQLHAQLKVGFPGAKIYSEYGMTELLSMAYRQNDEGFRTPPWMKIILRETTDPLTLATENKTGGINVIDLANVNSCSFIATQDLGKPTTNGGFEVLGRFDNSEVRGCNLMVAD